MALLVLLDFLETVANPWKVASFGKVLLRVLGEHAVIKRIFEVLESEREVEDADI